MCRQCVMLILEYIYKRTHKPCYYRVRLSVFVGDHEESTEEGTNRHRIGLK